MLSCVLCNSRYGKSYLIAQQFGWDIFVAEESPDISTYEFIVIVCANTGDEELQASLESYLIDLQIRGRRYAICELGNYFGFERSCFGCKKIVRRLMAELGWQEMADISIDSLPEIDLGIVTKWAKTIQNG